MPGSESDEHLLMSIPPHIRAHHEGNLPCLGLVQGQANDIILATEMGERVLLRLLQNTLAFHLGSR